LTRTSFAPSFGGKTPRPGLFGLRVQDRERVDPALPLLHRATHRIAGLQVVPEVSEIESVVHVFRDQKVDGLTIGVERERANLRSQAFDVDDHADVFRAGWSGVAAAALATTKGGREPETHGRCDHDAAGRSSNPPL
jgi:hypothetical protein